MCSSEYRISPVRPVFLICSSRRSKCRSIGGNHAQPISVITNLRFGNRSKTPEKSSCTNGRCE